jgi:hypothetical protein
MARVEFNLAEAAYVLGLSTSMVLYLRDARQLRCRAIRGKRRNALRFDAGEVLRLKAERDRRGPRRSGRPSRLEAIMKKIGQLSAPVSTGSELAEGPAPSRAARGKVGRSRTAGPAPRRLGSVSLLTTPSDYASDL